VEIRFKPFSLFSYSNYDSLIFIIVQLLSRVFMVGLSLKVYLRIKFMVVLDFLFL
jgi:hypothetical protein